MSNSSGNDSDGNDRREVQPILETSDDLHSMILSDDFVSRILSSDGELFRLMHAFIEENQNTWGTRVENQNGLQEEDLEKLVVTVYSETQAAISSAVGEKTMCLICHENYKDGDLIVRLHCNHIFCKNCLFTWLKSNKTCPCCRDDVMRHLKQ